MRFLLSVIVILATLYAGYWGLGYRGITQTLDQAEADAQGGLRYSARDVTGFPSRFDVTYRDLAVAQAGISYATPLAQVFTLAYKPNHVIAFAPGPHEIAGPFGAINLTSEDLRASLRVTPNTDLALAEARLTGTALVLEGDLAAAQIGDLTLAVRAAEPPSYGLYLQAKDLTPAALAPIVEGTALPSQITLLRLSGLAQLDGPLDRHGTPSTLQALRIDSGVLRWGDSKVTLTGDLEFDGQGLASGPITIQAQDWQPLVDLAARHMPDPDQLRRLAMVASDENGQLRIVISLRSGRAFLGPLPIGNVPPIAYRQ